jgi:hypothetical protein
VRIPGTQAQAAAPMTAAKTTPRKAANAKCRTVPAATCPAETGMALAMIRAQVAGTALAAAELGL